MFNTPPGENLSLFSFSSFSFSLQLEDTDHNLAMKQSQEKAKDLNVPGETRRERKILIIITSPIAQNL